MNDFGNCLLHGFVFVVVAAAGAFFEVNIVNRNEYAYVFRFVFVFIAAAGACFPVNIFKQRQAYRNSSLYVFRYVDFQSSCLEIRESNSHKDCLIRWEFDGVQPFLNIPFCPLAPDTICFLPHPRFHRFSSRMSCPN